MYSNVETHCELYKTASDELVAKVCAAQMGHYTIRVRYAYQRELTSLSKKTATSRRFLQHHDELPRVPYPI